jgi:hypothetical protein
VRLLRGRAASVVDDSAASPSKQLPRRCARGGFLGAPGPLELPCQGRQGNKAGNLERV